MSEKPDMARIRPDMWMPSGCVKGVLKDEGGGTKEMVSILACSEVICQYGMTAADGTFSVCGVHIEPLAVKTEEECAAMPRRGAALLPSAITKDGDNVDVGTLWVPFLGAGTPLVPKMAAPQTLAAGDGLSLTIVSNDFLAALGSEQCTVAARLVPDGKHFDFKVPDGGKVLATYALSPFTSTSKSKIGVKADLMTTPSAEVHFWTVNYLDGLIDPKPAIGHADANGTTVSTDPGDGITQITYLLISAKP